MNRKSDAIRSNAKSIDDGNVTENDSRIVALNDISIPIIKMDTHLENTYVEFSSSIWGIEELSQIEDYSVDKARIVILLE